MFNEETINDRLDVIWPSTALVQELYSVIPEKTEEEVYETEIPVILITERDQVIEMLPGSLATLVLDFAPFNYEFPNLCWEVSDMSVLTISDNGLIHAKVEGEVDITVTALSLVDEKDVKVKVTVGPVDEEPEGEEETPEGEVNP